ncbi:S1/P1 nuclease [Cupriavidus metallidurans]|jgi:S1/P1 Nuclease|uniref:S1/P1 nuclease n=1 Tax=Cupriavidus metallidurans TaxID=119219 RepID=UPI000CE03807|nr:S1/P1 nuclease [Cupriavidus metallidurans]AVA38233.1 hypothetical protein C3Z06_32015 [Cupriavidus metallidurans]
MQFYRRLQLSALAIGLAFTAVPARPWNADGHGTVGKLAEALIVGTHAETEVHKILGMGLEQAAVWADCVKGVTQDERTGAFTYKSAGHYPACQPFETAQGKREMVAFAKRNWRDCHPNPEEEVCHRQYHNAGVSLQRKQYVQGLIGTSDHDIVAAIKAAILVLQGSASPAPIQFAGKRDALLVLAHYVGDIHQPLHVTAVYLDAQGHIVDPDQDTFDPQTKTMSGHSIRDGSEDFHREWDTVPAALMVDRLGVSGINEARAIPVSAGDAISWPAQWATDTLLSSGPAFSGASYTAENSHKHWNVTLPADYATKREALQRAQLLKAGARLAQLLQVIWP